MGGFQAVSRLPPPVISSYVCAKVSSKVKRNVTILHRISHESLTLTKVNTYGLLYEWKGSDDTLKPLLLAAHQGSAANL
jgi:hypothetical protein